MIYSDELLALAKRIFWFGTLEEALEFPKRFLTYAMTYASDEDIEILRKYFSDDDFKATLDDPAPGIAVAICRKTRLSRGWCRALFRACPRLPGAAFLRTF